MFLDNHGESCACDTALRLLHMRCVVRQRPDARGIWLESSGFRVPGSTDPTSGYCQQGVRASQQRPTWCSGVA